MCLYNTIQKFKAGHSFIYIIYVFFPRYLLVNMSNPTNKPTICICARANQFTPFLRFTLQEMHFSVHKTFLLNTLPLLDAVCLFVCFFSLLSYILAQKILLEWKTLMFAICSTHWSWYTYKFTNIIESCSCTSRAQFLTSFNSIFFGTLSFGVSLENAFCCYILDLMRYCHKKLGGCMCTIV